MSDYGSDDEFFELDFDYAYVEDGYHIADELAERTVASPPLYYDDDDYEWDRYDYYEDIEDGSAGYYDYDTRHGTGNEKSTTGQKRQRPAPINIARKKRKISENKARDPPSSPTPTVAWRTQKERLHRPAVSMNVAAQRPVALLKDWRERFEHSSIEDLRHKATILDDDEELSDVGPEATEGEPTIDEDALRAALVSRLGSAGSGLEGLDPNMLLQYAMRMMGGGEDADDIAGELADNILERDEDDPSAEGISTFLSRHEEGEEGVDEAMTPADSFVEEPPNNKQQTPRTSKTSKQIQHPPTPSSSDTSKSTSRAMDAISPGPTITEAGQNDAANAKPPASQPASRKRKAESPEPGPEKAITSKAKRTTRSFDAPTASSKARMSSRNVSNSTSKRGKKR